MEKPTFPLPPGKYLVTGDRKVTTVLTILPKGKNGAVPKTPFQVECFADEVRARIPQ